MFSNNLLMGAASAASGEPLIEIGNSALFSTSTQSLSDTPSSAGDLRDWTVSFWVYLNSQTAYQIIFSTEASGGNGAFQFGTINNFSFLSHNSSGANHVFQVPTRAFRDIGWYHMVIRCSSTANDGTAVYDNMNISIWANGEAQAVTSVPYNTPSGGPRMFSGGVQRIGAAVSTTPNYYVAEIVYLDGQKQNADAFGQYDSTGTFWTPKSPDVIKELTFGTNGFYFDNATNPQTDASGEGNNYTNNNSVTTSTHTPTNLNALWNPLSTVGLTTRFPQLSVGNTTAGFSGSTSARAMLTLPVFYNTHLEFTVTQGSGSDTNYPFLQVFPYSTDDYNGDQLVNQSAAGGSGGTGLASGASIPNWTTGDRVTLEIDTTNGRIYVFIDGSAVNSANPGAGSGFTFDFTMPASGQLAIVWISQTSAGKTVVVSNPAEFTDSVSAGYFGLTSTIASAQTTRTKSNLEEYFSTTTYEGNGAGQRVGKFLPFTNTFTVGKGALFVNANSEDLSRGSMSGTATTFTISMWVKRAEPAVGSATANFMFTTASDAGLSFGNNSTADVLAWYSGSYTSTTRVFSDQSQWINVVLKSSSGTGTAYVNGVEMLGSLTVNGADATMAIGSYNNASNFFDGYMAEVVMIDGTALEPSNFGQVDTSTGRWIPKDVSGLTFGTNGFYLNFAASDDVGNDVSGNNNDFTNNNTVVQVGDTPTVNFATFNDTDIGSAFTLSNGNRTVVGSSATTFGTADTGLSFSKEKIFVMGLINDGASGASVNTGMAICPDNFAQQNLSTNNGAYGTIQTQGSTIRVYQDSNGGITDGQGGDILVTHSIAAADGDYFTMAVDGNTGNIWFGLYDTSAGTHQYLPAAAGGTAGNPATGANPTITQRNFTNPTNYFGSPPTDRLVVTAGGFNTGSSITLITNSADMPMSMPTDYLEFKQDNLTTGESYQTAFSWIKNRDATDSHMLFDRVRGIYNDLHSDANSAEVTNVNTLQRFLNGGVQVGNDVQVNTVSESYVAWNWYTQTAGTGSSNTDGTINTTSTLVDTNLGLSISKYTGTGANATVGHGLGVAPEFIMIKNLDQNDSWLCYHSGIGNTKALFLDLTNATDTNAIYFNNTSPTSSVFSLGTTEQGNSSSETHVAYCFAPSQFTSIGSYEGNSNADGTFIPTVNSLGVPIQPAWFLHKCADTGLDWYILDNVSQTYNVLGPQVLSPNTNEAAPSTSATYREADFVTGGIKIRGAGDQINNSNTHIYMAFGTPIIDVDGRIITGF